MNNTNFKSYSQIENIANFKDQAEINEYRKKRFIMWEKAVNFLGKFREANQKWSVYEIGSGNSGLLYSLDARGWLTAGVGIEYSQTRHEFAELWKKQDNYTRITNLQGDFAMVELEPMAFDLCLVIDNTFSYLAPENAAYPEILLQQASQRLKTHGRIVIDFHNYNMLVPGQPQRSWSRFPDTDPFRWGLYENLVENGVNTGSYIYVRPDGSQDSRVEHSQVYSLQDMESFFEKHGFALECHYGGWDESAYDAKTSKRLLVVAKKIS